MLKKMISVVLTVTLLAITTGVGVAQANVYDEKLFEIGNAPEPWAAGSGDIADNLSISGPDWASLFTANGTVNWTAVEYYGGVAAVFIADEHSLKGAVDNTHFASSNKNNDLVSTWNWDTGNEPPKDDLTNVYAYVAIDPDDGHLIIYVGLERTATEGQSHVDIEMNQQLIGLDKSVPCGDDGVPPGDSSPCEFIGEKTVGDILLAMDFEQGGRLGFMEMRLWNGTEYILSANVTNEGCTENYTACVFNNGNDIPSGNWTSYDRHGNIITTLEANQFTELALDLTEILGYSPCLNTIQAHTRTSGSFNSELKDFALGSFEICSVDVDKTGDALSKAGDNVTYTFTITNTGAADLYLQSVIDDQIDDLTATANASGCDNLAPGDNCTFTVVFPMPASPDPFVNEVTVTYAPANGAAANLTATDNDSVDLFTPLVTIDKSGAARSKAGDNVTYTYFIENTSTEDSPNLILQSIVDDRVGDLYSTANASGCGELAPGDNCTFTAEYEVTLTDNASDAIDNIVNVSYNVDGFPNTVNVTDDHTVTVLHPSFTVEKDCWGFEEPLQVGDAIHWKITIKNTGDVALNLEVVDSIGGIEVWSTNYTAESGNVTVFQRSDTVTAEMEPSVTNTVNVTATLPVEYGLPNVLFDSASDTCDVILEGATRTPGFWQTHLDYTNHIIYEHLGINCTVNTTWIDLGWITIGDNCSANWTAQAMGVFWANNAKDCDGGRRDKVCQAQVTVSFHALAAILNSALDNGAPLPVDRAEIAEILGSGNITAIHELGRILAEEYNEYYDDVPIIDSDGYEVQPANPRGARDIADICFANCPQGTQGQGKGKGKP